MWRNARYSQVQTINKIWKLFNQLPFIVRLCTVCSSQFYCQHQNGIEAPLFFRLHQTFSLKVCTYMIYIQSNQGANCCINWLIYSTSPKKNCCESNLSLQTDTHNIHLLIRYELSVVSWRNSCRLMLMDNNWFNDKTSVDVERKCLMFWTMWSIWSKLCFDLFASSFWNWIS